MSRSYKKVPIVKDNRRGRKFAKRKANKKVKNHLKNNDLANGSSYRKVYNPWDIYDWVDYCSYSDYLWYNDDLSYSECYKNWYTSYKMK